MALGTSLDEAVRPLNDSTFDVVLLGDGGEPNEQVWSPFSAALAGRPLVLLGAALPPLAREAGITAYECLPEPATRAQLSAAMMRAGDHRRVLSENRRLRGQLRLESRLDEIVGLDGGLRSLAERLVRVAATELAVLVRGDTGSGKNLVARTVHRESPRADAPLAVLRCRALPSGMIDSELFGTDGAESVGGPCAGRLEQAHGGTLIIDEIAELPPSAQARLVSTLEAGEVQRLGAQRTRPANVRLVCTSNEDLEKRVREGHFRQDLYYAISVATLDIPPLSARRQDVAALVEHVLRRAFPKRPPRVHQGTLAVLESYAWPGNVRELQNVLRRSFVVSGQGTVLPEHLPAHVQAAFGDRLPERLDEESLKPYQRVDASSIRPLEECERELVLRAVELCRGNLSEAARRLGIGRTTLYRKLERYGVST